MVVCHAQNKGGLSAKVFLKETASKSFSKDRVDALKKQYPIVSQKGVDYVAVVATVAENFDKEELQKEGIRVNAISAGPIKTLSAKGIKDFGTILDIVEEKAPLHRNVTTREVGDVTSFLFSNMASAITGEVIHVDNGFSTVGV